MGKVDNKSNKIFKDLVMLPMNISVTQVRSYISNLIKDFMVKDQNKFKSISNKLD